MIAPNSAQRWCIVSRRPTSSASTGSRASWISRASFEACLQPHSWSGDYRTCSRTPEVATTTPGAVGTPSPAAIARSLLPVGRRTCRARVWLRKREAYESLTEHQLQLVAISSSQADEVRRSSLLGRFPVTVIPCAVDVRTFFPRPRAAARECLGLPADRSIVLMVADYLRSPEQRRCVVECSTGPGGREPEADGAHRGPR